MSNSDLIVLKTWYDGDFTGNLNASVWVKGNFNKGRLVGTFIKEGTFNEVNIRSSSSKGGSFKNCSINNVNFSHSTIEDSSIKSSTVAGAFTKRTVFYNSSVEGGTHSDGDFIDTSTFYAGTYINCRVRDARAFTCRRWENGCWDDEKYLSWGASSEAWKSGFILDEKNPDEEFEKYYGLVRKNSKYIFSPYDPKSYNAHKKAFALARKKGLLNDEDMFFCKNCCIVKSKTEMSKEEENYCVKCV